LEKTLKNDPPWDAMGSHGELMLASLMNNGATIKPPYGAIGAAIGTYAPPPSPYFLSFFSILFMCFFHTFYWLFQVFY